MYHRRFLRAQPLRGAEITDQRRVVWLKALVIVYGAVSIALAFCAHFVGPLLQASMTVLGIVGGPMLAVFTLGIFVPYVNQKVCAVCCDKTIIIIIKNQFRFRQGLKKMGFSVPVLSTF